MKSIPHSKLIRSLLVITLGSAVFAFGFVAFYQPNNIPSGGLTGLAQVINRLVPVLPVGVTVIVLNIPLFVLALKFIGGKLLFFSLYAMFISSVFIDGLTALRSWSPTEPMLGCIFAGLLMGLSMGLVLSQGATTGGTDLAARLIKLKLAWLSMGKLMLAADLVVILLATAVFRNVNSMLYGLVALYIASIVTDSVLYGVDPAKVAYIISDKSREIADTIVRDLDRGVTILHGQGAYSGAEKQVLMCAFKQKEIATIKSVVKELDPDAFLIVCDAHDVLGEGFRAYKKDDI